MKKKQKKALVRIIISAVLLGIANIFPSDGAWFYIRIALFAASYFIIGYDVLVKAGKGIVNGRVFDENFLMAVATVGAIGLSVYDGCHDFNEAVSVMLLYQIGELFQSIAVGKSRKNITSLMDIRPDYANIETDGKLCRVSPDEVETGTVIIVNPGEKIPIDGTVTDGESMVNTSALTGESVPRSVKTGDSVISGCINMSGVLKIRTSKAFGESTASKILDLVENASARKSKSENFISKFARIYTPAVCISALVLALLPPIAGIISGAGADFATWIYRALTFLVISCPCALVISVPLSFFAGIGCAGSNGVLVKGSNYLETLSGVKTVIFDKTGTLTKGVFEVSAIHHNIIDENKLLEYAAYAECASSHPIAASLKKAYGKEIDRTRVCDIREISGHGISSRIDGKEVLVGNGKLMQKYGIGYSECHKCGTVVHVAIDEKYYGHIVISDVVKPEAAKAISELKKAGVSKTVMLTGDSAAVAKSVGDELGIDEVHAELLPADKVEWTERILARTGKGEKVAFAGDGINDAPVLSRADVGIAMGAMGSDAAIEAADVVLMDDNPEKIVDGIKISRKCIRIVYENIIFSLGVKGVCLILGALGIANMWVAIFADVGVMIIAILNAIRALKK